MIGEVGSLSAIGLCGSAATASGRAAAMPMPRQRIQLMKVRLSLNSISTFVTGA